MCVRPFFHVQTMAEQQSASCDILLFSCKPTTGTFIVPHHYFAVFILVKRLKRGDKQKTEAATRYTRAGNAYLGDRNVDLE
jgi:hypothetical protein